MQSRRATAGTGEDDREILAQEIDLLGRSAAELPAVTPLLAAVTAVLEASAQFDAACDAFAALPLAEDASSIEERLLPLGDRGRARRVWITFSAFAVLLSLALLLTVARQRATPELAAAGPPAPVGAGDVELRLAEQLTALDEALADLELAQRGLEHSRHTEQLQQVAGEIDARMSTPLWYLRSNTALLNERLDDLQAYLDESSQTLSLFAGPDTDRRRVAQGLTKLRRMLAEKGLDDSVNEVRTLLRDNAAGLDELVQDVQSIVAGLHPADPSDPTDVAALAEQCATRWNAENPDALVTVALEGPLIVEANEPPLRRALMRTFAAVSVANPTRRSAVIISAVPGIDHHIDLLIASADASESTLAVTEPTLAGGADAGLDLAIAAKLVRACGGELTAATTDGDAGTLCTITLPVLLARRAGGEGVGTDTASGIGS
jgi:signal transduction histidine kinase